MNPGAYRCPSRETKLSPGPSEPVSENQADGSRARAGEDPLHVCEPQGGLEDGEVGAGLHDLPNETEKKPNFCPPNVVIWHQRFTLATI